MYGRPSKAAAAKIEVDRHAPAVDIQIELKSTNEENDDGGTWKNVLRNNRDKRPVRMIMDKNTRWELEACGR